MTARRFFMSTIKMIGGINYSIAPFAYSVRKLPGYSGSLCMRVRRASDSATQDIGFDINGLLDTSAISSFCGASIGYVNIWYNQGTYGDAVKNSSSIEPVIYTGSGFNLFNSIPYLDGSNFGFLERTGFSSLDHFLDREHFSSTVIRTQIASSLGYMFNINQASPSNLYRITFTVDTRALRDGYISCLNGVDGNDIDYTFTLGTSTLYIYSESKDSSDLIELFINGLFQNSHTDTGRLNQSWNMRLFSQERANVKWQGMMAEFVSFSGFDSQLRSDLITEQNTYFGTY